MEATSTDKIDDCILATETMSTFAAGRAGLFTASTKAQEDEIALFERLVFDVPTHAAHNTSAFVAQHGWVFTDGEIALLNNNILNFVRTLSHLACSKSDEGQHSIVGSCTYCMAQAGILHLHQYLVCSDLIEDDILKNERRPWFFHNKRRRWDLFVGNHGGVCRLGVCENLYEAS